MNNSKMLAQALKEEAEEKSIWHAFRALVLELGCTLELLGKNLKQPDILTLLVYGAAWELDFLKHCKWFQCAVETKHWSMEWSREAVA